MGLFFSNIHIRKNDQFDLSRLEDALIKSMTSQGYQLVDSEEDSELSAQICCDDITEWVSVASDFFDFQTPEDTRSAAEPLSVLFQTDVLAVTCVDSDFMMLNLINEADGTDAWINVGMPYDDQFPRRTGFRNKKNNVVGIGFGAWENKVTDYDAFQSVMQAEYTFAEDALCRAGELLGLPPSQSTLTADDDSSDTRNTRIMLFFARHQNVQRELPKLELNMPSLMPCVDGKDSCVFVSNKGGASQGIAVTFQGDYIEKDEITFDQVQLEYDISHNPRRVIPIQLEKRKAADGSYVWYWEDKEFAIPEKVDPGLSLNKYLNMEQKRIFGVRFVPHGNPRKMLDIVVFIAPLENNCQKGAACWYAWRHSSDKAAYIEEFNKNWKGFDDSQILDPNDFDL